MTSRKKRLIFLTITLLLNVVLKNASRIPNFKYKTDKWLTSIEISEDYILLIVKNLNADKALGWDNLLIMIIKNFWSVVNSSIETDL